MCEQQKNTVDHMRFKSTPKERHVDTNIWQNLKKLNLVNMQCGICISKKYTYLSGLISTEKPNASNS